MSNRKTKNTTKSKRRSTARIVDPPKPALAPRQALPAPQGGGKEVTAEFKAGKDI